MDSVGVERAGLQKDLDETNAEIHRVLERLEDDLFVAKAKPAIVEEARTQLRQLEERRALIEENLKHVGAHRLGSLPSAQSGTWSPLLLHESPLAEVHDEQPWPPIGGVQRSEFIHTPLERSARKQETLSQMIAEIVVKSQRDKRTVSELRACVELAGDDGPTLRLLASAFSGLGEKALANQLRDRVREEDDVAMPPEPTPAAPPATGELPVTSPDPDSLPDARDGLTRMQRLVLSVMHELSFRADGALKKTELVVEELRLAEPQLTAADVDATLLQLTHPWSALNRLVEVSGAQCRLTPLGEELFVDYDKHTADLQPGATFKLPRVLPVTVPLLLAKGTDGIPPYNLSELVAVAARLHAGNLAPDFPQGGVIERLPNSLFVEGRGRVAVHAKLELQTEANSVRARFIASELPWPLQRADVVARLKSLALEGVTGLRDESPDGQDRIVIELEHVAFAREARALLKASGVLTQVHEVQFLVNDDGRAARVSLYEILDRFRSHRCEVTRTRIRHELSDDQNRIEAIEALFVTSECLDPVIRVIVDANDPQEAFWGLKHIASADLKTRGSFAHHTPLESARLRRIAAGLTERLSDEVPALAMSPRSYEPGFTDHQARAILATRRLKSIPRESLFRECVEHARTVARLQAPLENIRALLEIVSDDLLAAGKRHPRPRRTRVGPLW